MKNTLFLCRQTLKPFAMDLVKNLVDIVLRMPSLLQCEMFPLAFMLWREGLHSHWEEHGAMHEPWHLSEGSDGVQSAPRSGLAHVYYKYCYCLNVDESASASSHVKAGRPSSPNANQQTHEQRTINTTL